MKPLITWPIALITGACAPWTPASSLSYSAEPVPDGIAIRLPPRHEVMQRWLLPPDQPWAPFTKATLLSALDEQPPPTPESLPDVRRLSIVQRAQAAALALARGGVPPRTLWIVDLRGAASVAFVATLSLRAPVAPILTFNNWPAEDEVIPAEETLSALLFYSPVMPPRNVIATPVFALDAFRLAYREESVDEATDNRYALSSADFPSASQLGPLGIDHVIYVVERWGDGEVEEDDLHDVFATWADAGVPITVMDLGQVVEEPRVDVYLGEHRYYPVPRVTIVEGPWLHEHSPGGFGGHEGAPHFAGARGGWLSGGGG
ncbi:MAG TPA: hypothetical protein VHC69_18325 [Polyangiaceae bacterium]|nr:hypothetical protein [Polyangiaceae bacterium]